MAAAVSGRSRVGSLICDLTGGPPSGDCVKKHGDGMLSPANLQTKVADALLSGAEAENDVCSQRVQNFPVAAARLRASDCRI